MQESCSEPVAVQSKKQSSPPLKDLTGRCLKVEPTASVCSEGATGQAAVCRCLLPKATSYTKMTSEFSCFPIFLPLHTFTHPLESSTVAELSLIQLGDLSSMTQKTKLSTSGEWPGHHSLLRRTSHSPRTRN